MNRREYALALTAKKLDVATNALESLRLRKDLPSWARAEIVQVQIDMRELERLHDAAAMSARMRKKPRLP